MRISNIYCTNFLGIELVDLRLRAPVTLLCGANGAGKSSCRDAVALALTADLGRVSLKKDAPALIREGADLAVCEVKNADGDEWRVTINRSGKIHDSQAGRDPHPAMAYVLDAQRLAHLKDEERRAFLFGLMGLRTTGEAILQRLEKRGCDGAKVKQVAPLLRSGFDAGHKEAKGKATETKGMWRQLTGENYGSDKAKTWAAGVPAWNAANLPSLQTEIKHADEALSAWQQSIGKLQAEKARRVQLANQMPALQAHADRVERIRAKLATDEATLQDLDTRIAEAQAAAGGAPRVGLVHDLAEAIAHVLPIWPNAEQSAAGWQRMSDVLAAYVREFGPVGAKTGNPEAAARLPALRQAHVTATSAVAHDRRDLDAAIGAGAQLASIEAELKQPFDTEALDKAQAAVAEISAQRAKSQAALDTQLALKREAEAADKKTAEALRHHIDVQQWDAIAEALSPDGIPAEILAEALDPVNDRLRLASEDTGWPQVVVHSDMRITAGLRAYGLLSESEQWRVDAMLAEAVSHISGLHMLVLDRVDVLDLPARGELLGWLDVLADAGEIATALLFATLKAAPTGLAPSTRAFWIENGVAVQQVEMAEAA